jgi:hypothetical protein
MDTTTLGIGAGFVVMLVLYMARRRSRMGKDD